MTFKNNAFKIIEYSYIRNWWWVCFLKFKHNYFNCISRGRFRKILPISLLSSVKGVTQIDNDLKSRASAYNNLKVNLQNLERKNA